MKSGDRRRVHKEATNQSLNQKSRCFYIGAFSFYRTFSFRLLRCSINGCNSYTLR